MKVKSQKMKHKKQKSHRQKATGFYFGAANYRWILIIIWIQCEIVTKTVTDYDTYFMGGFIILHYAYVL